MRTLKSKCQFLFETRGVGGILEFVQIVIEYETMNGRYLPSLAKYSSSLFKKLTKLVRWNEEDLCC